MSLVSQINALATRIGQEMKLRLKSANNLSDISNSQTALNNLANAAGGGNEYVLTKDTATGNILLKPVNAPADGSITYPKLASFLTSKATVTSTVDLSANGIGEITLSANTAFTFTKFQLNKNYLLIITANGFTPSWAVGARHIAVEGNAGFGTSGVFYVNLTCVDTTSGSEKLLTQIMKGA
jgi:hypothetical protein